jgi:hypothetical protein
MVKSFSMMLFTALLIGSLGCMQSAQYVEKHPEWGIVGVKSQQDEKQAVEMIRKHVGEDYVILETYGPHQPRTNAFDPESGIAKPVSPQKDGMGWYVKYAKKSAQQAQLPSGMGGQPAGATGLPQPDMTNIQQAGFQKPAPVTPAQGNIPTAYNPYATDCKDCKKQ